MADFKIWLNTKEYPTAQLPIRSHETDAGWDVHSVDNLTIPAGERRVVHTGIHFDIPNGWEIQIRSRSGLAAKQGIFVLNSPATIDTDYTGQIMVILQNTSHLEVKINKGERIGQLVFKEVPRITMTEISAKPINKSRGENGIGSTGK